MGKKITYNIRMSVMVTWTSLIIFGVISFFIRLQTHKLSEGHLKKVITEISVSKANETAIVVSQNVVATKMLAKAIDVIQSSPESRAEQTEILINSFFKDYPAISKIQVSRNYFQLDSTGFENQVNYIESYQNTNGEVFKTDLQFDKEQCAWYQQLANGSIFACEEPTWESQTETGFKQRLVLPIAISLTGGAANGNYLYCEIDLDPIQQLIQQYSNDLQSTIALLTTNGSIIAHTNDKIIHKQILDIQPEFDSEFSLSVLLKKSQDSVVFNKKVEAEKICFAYAPVNVQGIDKEWGLIVLTPEKLLMLQTKQIQRQIIWLFLAGIFLLTFLVYHFTRMVSSSIMKAIGVLKKISAGDTENVEHLSVKSNDEIAEMAESVNKLVGGFEKTARFASEIGKGNLTLPYEALGENDSLGNALLEMRQSLIHADTEEKKRKAEDEKLNWATQGIAKFGEVLRSNSNDIKELSYQIMSNLINYLNANQGALFVTNNADPKNMVLELTSAIAYGRDKFMKRTVGIGEELVGRCAFEKKSIYMTDIPQNYVQITSGLGTANPSALLLVPLVLNDETFGVLEMASFQPFESFQIEFVEKIAESIAATISNVKVNEVTSKLLEQSRVQAEELSAQEEEMRQNMEELQATQEEALRREQEMTSMINALSLSAFIVEYNMEATVISVNKKYADFLGKAIDEIVGQNHSDGYEFSDELKAEYDNFWHNLKHGTTQYQTNKVNFNGRIFWFAETYVPILHADDGLPYKVLKISYDITDQKLREIKIKEQQNEIDKERMLIDDYKHQIEMLNRQVAEYSKQNEIPKDNTQAFEAEKIALQQEVESYKEKLNELEIKLSSKVVDVHEDRHTEASKIDTDDHLLLEWTGDLAMGIEEIDLQHEQLVRLINQIDQSFIQEKTKKEIKDNIRSFIDFVSYHFGTEESYFEQFGFELADEHIAEHKLFLKELIKVQNDYASNKVADLTQPMLYIRRWLYNHIQAIDRKYKLLFDTNGV